MDIKSKEQIESLLAKYPEYKDALYCRGYYITDDNINEDAYPFYGMWSSKNINGYRIMVHPYQTSYYYTQGKNNYVLIGHAYNPFNMEPDENILLNQAADAYDEGNEKFFDVISEWTGIFNLFIFSEKDVFAVQDSSGNKGLYYGKVNGHLVMTQYTQIAADFYGLNMDDYVVKLSENKFFNIGNRYLPGDIAPIKELTRMVANCYLTYSSRDGFDVKRFYPTKPHPETKTEKEYNNLIEELCRLMKNNLELCAKKWPGKAALSLSAGMDSQTTFACMNGLYDKIWVYSYISKSAEKDNALAAKEVCEKLGIKHVIYEIPEKNEEVKDFYVLKEIIVHTNGYFKKLADNEMRKYIYFYHKKDLMDVEIKSWMAEVGRAFIDKKYELKMPEVLEPIHCSILQTRFFFSPRLFAKSNKLYAAYNKKYGVDKKLFNFDSADIYYWEVRMGSWGMQVANSLDVMHTITYPYGNRKIIELMLDAPYEKRLADKVQEDMKKVANKKLYDLDVVVPNAYGTKKRKILEKAYFLYRTIPYNIFHKKSK